ncbi:hypothetical protein M569_15357, partial [Genlisea aurea]
DSSSRKQWRKSNLFLEIPARSYPVSCQEFIPTPKRVPHQDNSPIRGKSSFRNLIPKLSCKNQIPNANAERSEASSSVSATMEIQDNKPPPPWSFSRIFTPRIKGPPSLPITPIIDSRPDSIIPSGNFESKKWFVLQKEGAKRICRSFSVPINLKEKRTQKPDSYFRVVPSTPRVKDGDIEEGTTTIECNDDIDEADCEDIPEDEAVCRICLVELREGGETLKMECSCRGELALAHQECAVKWFAIKGNKICDVCNQEVRNLPVTLLHIRSWRIRETRAPSFSEIEINRYRVWHEIPILVVVSMLAYFCFLEQLLVGRMGTNAIAISLPFSCVIGLVASLTSSIMVKRNLVWIYASIQFGFVVLFAHVFYSVVHMCEILSIVLAVISGSGLAMSLSSIFVEFRRWTMRRNADGNRDERPQ